MQTPEHFTTAARGCLRAVFMKVISISISNYCNYLTLPVGRCSNVGAQTQPHSSITILNLGQAPAAWCKNEIARFTCINYTQGVS